MEGIHPSASEGNTALIPTEGRAESVVRFFVSIGLIRRVWGAERKVAARIGCSKRLHELGDLVQCGKHFVSLQRGERVEVSGIHHPVARRVAGIYSEVSN